MITSKPVEHDPDEEVRLTEMIAEAGDPAVAPRPEFVALLRARVLDELGPPRRVSPWRARLIAGSAVAAVAAAAAVLALVLVRPTNAWAEIAAALQKKPWVHARILGPDGKVYAESWSSNLTGVSASRRGAEAEYHDAMLRIVTKYVPGEESIYRMRENPEKLTQSPDFFRQLLESKDRAVSPYVGMDVVAQSRRDVVEDGRAWADITLTLKVVGGDRKQDVRYRVDPQTKLPHSSVFQSIEGPIGTILFDYPENGPHDIFDLGVPRTAKIVDRLPGNDLETILSGLKAGRVRFDDYRAIVDWDGFNINRVYRKGRKWRAELLLPSPTNAQQFPRNADAAWWKAHQGELTFFVQAICDGERVYYYRPEGNGFMPGANGPPKPKLSMEQAINPSDDPFMPWPHLFAEHAGHPAVWQPNDEREFLLEPKPTDGPPQTIRLRVRDTRFPAQERPDLYKLWLDPRQDYLALRAESSVFESLTTKPPKIAFVDTSVIESIARSPLGHWYPTRVLRKTSDSKSEQIKRYLLEFDVPIPDDLFRPLKP
jgi:hypothetical protein